MWFNLLVILSYFLKFGSLQPPDLECDWSVQQLSCPPFGTTDWHCLKGKLKCTSGKEYHCLKDEDGKWIQVCAESKTCLKGQEPIYSSTDGIKCQPCSDLERYEPVERILSSAYSECRGIKTVCHKDVSFECVNITAKYTQDRQCKCDYTKDYIPQNYDFDSESWVCKETDKLNCVQEPCPEDAAGMKERRGPDYRCTPDTVPTIFVPSHISTRSSTTAANVKNVTGDVPTVGTSHPVTELTICIMCIVIIIGTAYVACRKIRSRHSACRKIRSRHSVNPSMPKGPLVIDSVGRREIGISWQASDNLKTSLLEYYGIYIVGDDSSKTLVKTVEPDQTSCIVTDLTVDTPYKLCVMAENTKGKSKPLEMKTAVRTKKITVPGKPRSLALVDIKATSITFTWDPPVEDGGSPILYYFIEYRKADIESWEKGGTVSANVTTWTQNRVVKGHEYVFRVFAVNDIGKSEPLASNIKVSYKPSIPMDIKVKPVTATELVLTWKPPSDDGGSNVELYYIRRRANGHDWEEIGTFPDKSKSNSYKSETISCKIKLPDEMGSYFFGVCAENENGKGEFNDTTKPVGPPEVPESVQCLDVKQTDLTLTWKPPAYDGGTPVLKYIVKRKPDVLVGTVQPLATRLHVPGLAEGTQYHFYLTAHNLLGSSKPVEIEVMTESATVPDKPGGPVKFSKRSKTSVTLSWKPPKFDGGLPVESFYLRYGDVETDEDWKTELLPESQTSCIVNNLREDTKYKFEIYAVNRKGKSEPLESDVLPLRIGLPGEPLNLKVSDIGYTEIALSWDPPGYDGGFPLINYTIEQECIVWWEKVKEVKPETTACKLTGLKSGTNYRYRIGAVNEKGIGKKIEMEKSVYTKSLKEPGPPAGLLRCNTVGDNSVEFSWKPPTDDGGTCIFGYIIQLYDQDWTKVGFVSAERTSWLQADLLVNQEYLFRIRAENSKGIGKPLQFPYLCRPKQPPTTLGHPSPPSQPENFEVEKVDANTVKLKWSGCKSDGGSKCSAFVIEKREDEFDDWVLVTKLSPKIFRYTVKSLCCKEVSFSVAAINSAGRGEAAQNNQPIRLKRAPGPPTGPLIAKDIGANELKLCWLSPSNDGDDPVTGYVIEKYFGNGWREIEKINSRETEYRVQKLAPETVYNFRVKAENSVGFSDYLEMEQRVVTKKPWGPPSGPLLASDLKANELLLLWKPPLCKGNDPLTGYTVQMCSNADWIDIGNTPPTETTFHVTNLTENAVYRFRIFAKSKICCSDALDMAEQIRARRSPQAAEVSISVQEVTNNSVTFKWSGITEIGGVAVESYHIRRKEEDMEWETLASVHPPRTSYKAIKLITGKRYQFSVTACNRVAKGPDMMTNTIVASSEGYK